MFRTVLAPVILTLAIVPSARAQVRVTVPPKNYTMSDKIMARVRNDTSQPVTICVEAGQFSARGDVVVSTPIPFFIEQESRQGWKVLLIGPDVGSSRHAAVVEPKQSLEFSFWPPSAGNLRLRMQYWRSARPDLDCVHEPKGAKEAKPATFRVYMTVD